MEYDENPTPHLGLEMIEKKKETKVLELAQKETKLTQRYGEVEESPRVFISEI